jgi:hypothetical protein
MQFTLKSKEKGDGFFAVRLVTPEETIQLGDYIKSSSTGQIRICNGWSMTSFVAKLIGISPAKLLHLVDEGNVTVDVSIKN